MHGLLLILNLFLFSAEAGYNCHELEKSVEMQRFLFQDCMLKTIDKAGGRVRSIDKTARRCAGKVGILGKIQLQLLHCQFKCPEDSFAYDHWGKKIDVCEAVQGGSIIKKSAQKQGVDLSRLTKFARLGEKGIPLDGGRATSFNGDLLGEGDAVFPPETNGELENQYYFMLSDEGASPLSQGTTRPALKIERGEVISGSLHRSIVSETLIRSTPRVEYCFYREWKKSRELAGDVEVKFEILSNGRVGNVSIEASTIQSERVDYCVKRLISMMTFSRPTDAKPVIAKYTFAYNAPF
jgi:hypothetical protein